MFTYQLEPELSPDEFIDLLHRSTLGVRRPVDDRERMAAMIAHCDILWTARHDGRLVGISRALTDFSFCVYLSDLAVDAAYQRRGIGQELLRRTHATAGLQTRLILLAAPAAESYYPHIGLEQHHSCWTISPHSP